MSSARVLEDDPIRVSPRRSAIWRLSAVYFVAFIVVAVIFTVAAVELVRAKNAERVRALASAELEAVLDKIGDGPPEVRAARATAVVMARSARPAGQRVYRLEQNGRTVAGGLSGRLRPLPHGWFALDGPGDRRGLALQAPLGAGAVLTVGQLYEDRGLEAELLRIGAVALALAAISALVVGPWASRRIVRKVEAVNAVCREVEAGDLSARAAGADSSDEFGALSRHVNAMLERIDSLVTGLSDVSNRVAHDLRTPMARLKSDLEIAARAETLEEARAMAGAAAVETDEILQTFESLLDIVEVEAGSAGRISPMNLHEAAASAVELYQAVAEDRQVTLRLRAEPAAILGERSLIVRLVANLLDNAIKFSPGGGEVSVRIETNGAEAVLTVEDHGPGVAPEERERVLGRFTRGSGAGVTPGHGLGLALVAAVAKRHGAKLALEDAEPGLRVRAVFRRFTD